MQSIGGLARACVLALSVVVALVVGLGPSSAATSGVQLGFEWLPAQVTSSKVLYSGGTFAVRSAVRAGGSLSRVNGYSDDSAVRFPAASSSTQPRAVLTVTPDPSGDDLNPRGGDFSYGADFALDQQSSGMQDNGDNIVERGLYAYRGQWKLQVDHGLVSCRITGDQTSVVVKVRPEVTRGVWYRAGCARQGDTITASLQRLGSSTIYSTIVRRSLGTVDTSGCPMSIGGKANVHGAAVAGNSDQFNGVLDNVYYSLG